MGQQAVFSFVNPEGKGSEASLVFFTDSRTKKQFSLSSSAQKARTANYFWSSSLTAEQKSRFLSPHQRRKQELPTISGLAHWLQKGKTLSLSSSTQKAGTANHRFHTSRPSAITGDSKARYRTKAEAKLKTVFPMTVNV